MTRTLDCAINRLPVRSICSGKGERRKGKEKKKGNGDLKRESEGEKERERRKGKGKRKELRVNCVNCSWLCVFCASQSELRHL